MKRRINNKNPNNRLEMEFITEVMSNFHYVMRNPEKFKPVLEDKAFIIRAADLLRNHHLELFRLLKDDFKNDRNLVIKYLEKNGHILGHVPEHFKDDELVVKAAMKNQGYAINYASERLKANRDLAYLAIKNNGHALEAVDNKFKDDEELVLMAVKYDGRTIQYVSERLKSDRDIVIEAIKNDGMAIKFIDDALKADKELALLAINHSRKDDILTYLDSSIRHDKELSLAAYKKNQYSFKYFTPELLKELSGRTEKEDIIQYLERAIFSESLGKELSENKNSSKKLKV